MSLSQKRSDLSDWIIHFVHDHKSSIMPYDWVDEYGMQIQTFPTSFHNDGTPDYNTYGAFDESFHLSEGVPAFTVIRKILHCGYIRCGWSFRKSGDKLKPTIYGPRPAVCFTEMPLNNLIQYVAKRNNNEFVTCYGIAFKRSELFNIGARNVIYGLSSPHKEAANGDPYYQKGLRCLSADCGLSLQEQYRYVYTSLSNTKPTDWTHEREWRWADLKDEYEMPGLPFLLDDLKGPFSNIIILVQTDDESQIILDELKAYYHAEENFCGSSYRSVLLEACKVVSFESLKKAGVELKNFNLDALPALNISKKIKQVRPSQSTLKKIELAIEEASKISYAASKEAFESYFNKDTDGHPKDVCGYANVITHDSQSEITQALIDLELVWVSGSTYYINNLNTYPTQSITVNEIGAKAAADFLTKELGQNFYMKSHWD